MDTKIYKLLFTLLIVFLLSFAAINWTQTVTYSERVVDFIDSIVHNSKKQPASAVIGGQVTGNTAGGSISPVDPNSPPPPPPPPPPQPNQAPQVNAGADQNNVSLSAGATLNAVVTDDGKPNPPALLGLFWSEVSGPDLVVFSSPNSASTNASFSSEGSYVLRLSAFDGEFFVGDEINITVGTNSSGGSSNSPGSPGSPGTPNPSNSSSIEELMARIRELQEMLRNLQSGTPQSTTYTPTSGSGASSASLDLKLGSTGPAVTALQKFLVAKKFLKMPAGSAYGTFGPATKAALAKFQTAHLIYPANGYYGLVTRKLVNQLR